MPVCDGGDYGILHDRMITCRVMLHYVITGYTLEEVVHHAIRCGDFTEFMRSVAQLRVYYANKRYVISVELINTCFITHRADVPNSDRENLVLALYLLGLLGQDKVSEFYADIEKFGIGILVCVT